MSKLILSTQVFENYAWDEHGNLGKGPNAYWKAKGGSDYVVKNIDINRAAEIAKKAGALIERDNDLFREEVINWEVVEDDYLTWFEKSQLEYDGEITHPARELIV